MSVVEQVVEMIQQEAALGKMLPKTVDEIEKVISDNRASIIEVEGQVVAFAAAYTTGHYTEIGSFVSHPLYRGRGYGGAVLEQIVRLASVFEKPIIALVSSQSIRMFEKTGFNICQQDRHPNVWHVRPGKCLEYEKRPGCDRQLVVYGHSPHYRTQCLPAVVAVMNIG